MATKLKTQDQLRDFRHLTERQILDKITESKKAMLVYKQDQMLGKLKNTAQIRELRKAIAKLATILDEKITQKTKDEA